LETSFQYLSEAYPRTPPAQLFFLASVELDTVTELLQGHQSLADQRRLFLLAGQLSHFLGSISFDVGDHISATKHYRTAWWFGREVGDPLLCASVLLNQSAIPFYRGQFRTALEFMQQAQSYVMPHTAARLAANEATAYGGMGDHPQMAKALHRAERQLGGETADRYGSVQPFTPGHLANYASLAFLLAEDHQAEAFARQAVTFYEVPGERQPLKVLALALLNLATALVQRRQPDPDQAATVALRAISVPPPHQHGLVGQRARELLARMSPWHARPAVKQFTEELRAYRPTVLSALAAQPGPDGLPAGSAPRRLAGRAANQPR
jgi:tetratricopeptide (TPR) repeat protein